ncbi:MAG: putative helix-destabilizing protein [Prokaryotic dsDNA virus sp.]|nr:MAG: putative helix-destabilizing protein [Prokaryotic dsDNA virus sp.]|tara:strand:+ start:485 stop:1165 length:681 start_codon:yes stop_codon:yes gene_type:complete
MADIRRTLSKFVTPKGRLVAPLYLNEPDGKFDDSPGKQKYKAGLLLTGDEACAFLKIVEEAWEGWLGAVKAATGKKPKTVKKNVQWFTSSTPKWDDIGASTEKLIDGLEEGDVYIKTAMKAVMLGRDGAPDTVRTPKIFDASGALMSSLPAIGFGSLGCIAGSFYGWTNAGVANMSLIMNGVQIIELREPGAGGGEEASDFGFTATEGFVQSSETFPSADEGDGNF